MNFDRVHCAKMDDDHRDTKFTTCDEARDCQM